MTDPDESALVARCQTGDDTAFAELVSRYKDLVFAVVVRAVPDRAQAEDLAQEVFLRVHRGLPYFRGEARLSTWIYKIVVNLCSQHKQRRPALRLFTRERDDDRPAVEPGKVDSAFGELELRDRLEKAIARLPPNYRVLIAGHYLKGIRYEDLAEALDMPLGTVKTHLYRAKRELRTLLQTELG